MTQRALTADDIRARIRHWRPMPEYTVLFEVADATGARHTGFADVIAMGTWPSRGLELEGMEIKVSKYDWRNEKKNPAKAEKFVRYCDRWWLVTSKGVVDRIDEIPANWGWVEIGGSATTDLLKPTAALAHLVVMKEAPKLTPEPLDRMMLAALMRSAGKVGQKIIESASEAFMKARRAQLEEDFEKRVLQRVNDARGEDKVSTAILAKLREALQEDKSYDDWGWLDQDEIVRAIVAVKRSGVVKAHQGLQYVHAVLETAAAQIRAGQRDLNLPVGSKPKEEQPWQHRRKR